MEKFFDLLQHLNVNVKLCSLRGRVSENYRRRLCFRTRDKHLGTAGTFPKEKELKDLRNSKDSHFRYLQGAQTANIHNLKPSRLM